MNQSNPERGSDRQTEREAFLVHTEWAEASLLPLGSDASIRQYFRLEGGPKPALLMDAPTAATTPPCPPSASEDERKNLGYAACVRGSGSSIRAYDAASKILSDRGILVPGLIEADYRAGFAIIEDLGSEHVADAALKEGEEGKLYDQAADILDGLREDPASPGIYHGWPLQTYDTLAYLTEAKLLTEWFLPHILGRTVSVDDEARLDDAWLSVFAELTEPDHLVHRDFHAENLMICGPEVGVLDFQDLMIGQTAYDWVSLLEDARRDVDEDVRRKIFKRGVEGAPDADGFKRDYAILAAQRNAKILGIFARLVHRDGKPKYTDLIPRVQSFFAQDLKREPVAPVAEVIAQIAPELTDA